MINSAQIRNLPRRKSSSESSSSLPFSLRLHLPKCLTVRPSCWSPSLAYQTRTCSLTLESRPISLFWLIFEQLPWTWARPGWKESIHHCPLRFKSLHFHTLDPDFRHWCWDRRIFNRFSWFLGTLLIGDFFIDFPHHFQSYQRCPRSFCVLQIIVVEKQFAGWEEGQAVVWLGQFPNGFNWWIHRRVLKTYWPGPEWEGFVFVRFQPIWLCFWFRFFQTCLSHT